jgi:hypothetical protein
MHEKVVKYLKAIDLIDEAKRDDEKGSEPTEKIGIAYEQAEAAWEDIPPIFEKDSPGRCRFPDSSTLRPVSRVAFICKLIQRPFDTAH